MSNEGDDYELFIANLIQNLEGTHRRISNLGYGRNNRLQGICGQHHQLDVSFIDSDFARPTLVVIECKRLNKPIDLEHVKVVKATLDDLLAAPHTPADANAIIVTTVGAREGARRFTKYYGIRIEQVHHGPNYSFRYENVIQAGIAMTASPSFTVTAVVSRQCQSCGQRFDVKDNEVGCPVCSE